MELCQESTFQMNRAIFYLFQPISALTAFFIWFKSSLPNAQELCCLKWKKPYNLILTELIGPYSELSWWAAVGS